MGARKLDIVYIPETKKKRCDIQGIKNVELKGGLEAWSGADSESHGRQGFDLIVNEGVRQRLRDQGIISPRFLWVRMQVGIRRLFIIACYAPVDSDPKEVKDAFLETANDTIGTCDHCGRIILLGDMNRWVGFQSQGAARVLDNFGDLKAYVNGGRLVSLFLEKGPLVKDTFFRHKMIHKYTWCKGNSHSRIGFLVADGRLRELVKGTRVMRGFECNTKQKRIEIEKLQKPEVRIDFQDRIYERIDMAT